MPVKRLQICMQSSAFWSNLCSENIGPCKGETSECVYVKLYNYSAVTGLVIGIDRVNSKLEALVPNVDNAHSLRTMNAVSAY
jgi:hypothetical protein